MELEKRQLFHRIKHRGNAPNLPGRGEGHAEHERRPEAELPEEPERSAKSGLVDFGGVIKPGGGNYLKCARSIGDREYKVGPRDKQLICAEADRWMGSHGSSFSDTIAHLRTAAKRTHPADRHALMGWGKS